MIFSRVSWYKLSKRNIITGILDMRVSKNVSILTITGEREKRKSFFYDYDDLMLSRINW